MVKRIILWKEKRRNRKLRWKLEGARKRLQTEKERNRLLRKMLSAAYRENGNLKDGWVVEWCDRCNRQVTVMWDPEQDGLMAYCPYCGERLPMCDSCPGECDFEYGNGICKAGAREV